MNEYYKNIDLIRAGEMFTVEVDLLDDAVRSRLGVDEGWIDMTEDEIMEYDIPYDAIEYGSSWMDLDLRQKILSDLLKPADHYLIFAYGCRWNGASGYMIAKHLDAAFSRSYDASIYPVSSSRGKKTLCCRESSHDVPTGSTTYVIALTESEAQMIEYADFHEVQRFVETCASKLAA